MTTIVITTSLPAPQLIHISSDSSHDNSSINHCLSYLQRKQYITTTHITSIMSIMIIMIIIVVVIAIIVNSRINTTKARYHHRRRSHRQYQRRQVYLPPFINTHSIWALMNLDVCWTCFVKEASVSIQLSIISCMLENFAEMELMSASTCKSKEINVSYSQCFKLHLGRQRYYLCQIFLTYDQT